MENNMQNQTVNEARKDNGLRFTDLWKVFKKSVVFMILVAVVFGTAAGLYTEFFVQKQYAVRIMFKVSAVDNSGSSAQNLSVAIVDDFVRLIKHDEELAKAGLEKMTVVNENGEEENCSPSRMNIAILQNSISTQTTVNSSIFSVTLTNSNPDYAFDMAVALGDAIPGFFEKTQQQIMGANGSQKGEVMLVRSAQMYDAGTPVAVYPNVTEKAVLFAFLGAVICYIAFLVYYVLDTTVRTEEDLKRICEFPVLGVIPAIDGSRHAVSKNEKNEQVKRDV
jgi:capsular polysaccharide biosynthesis protein